MKTNTDMPRWFFPAMVSALLAFAVLFQIAHARRLAVKPLETAGNRATDVFVLTRSYAQAHEGIWPPLDRAAGHFVVPTQDLPKAFALSPRFTTSTVNLPQALLLGNLNNYKAYTLTSYADIADYLYVGYAVANDREGLALITALRNGASTSSDITVPHGDGSLASSTLYRLRLSLEKALKHDGVIATEDPAALRHFPVLIGPRHEGYAWVVFLDQHVERLPYPGRFPLTSQFVSELERGMR